MLLVAVALIAGSVGGAGTSPAATQGKPRVQVGGNGPYWIVGTGWKFKERVTVTVTIGKDRRTRTVLAGTFGYFRFPVITIPLGCEIVFVSAHGRFSGNATTRRNPVCPPLAL